MQGTNGRLQERKIQTVEMKAKIKNRYNQVQYLTRNTVWESDKNTRKHNSQESQEVNPFPADNHEAARQESIARIT